MAAQILSFAAARAREPASRDWSRQELAEFYRVESALLQAGLQLESERGLSDEGDPWFVFCRVDTGEVFIHFARVDGIYVVDGAAFGSPSRGRDFGALVRDLIASHPLATVRRPGTNVMLHPAALLIALVGAAFFHSGKAHAAEVAAPAPHDAHRAGERRGLVFNVGGPAPSAEGEATRAVPLDPAEVAAVLTGVAIGLRDASPVGPATSGEAASAAPGALSVVGGLHDAFGRADAAASVSGGVAVLSTLSATDAHTALTVIAVFHDLARAVAPPVTSTSHAAGLVMDAAAPLPAPAMASPTTTPMNAVAPVLLVHLASGPLPQVEALTLVAADGALSRVAPDHVTQVDQLPTLLADLIAHGDIVPAPVDLPAADPSVGSVGADPSATDGSALAAGPGGAGASAAGPLDVKASHPNGVGELAALQGSHTTPSTGSAGTPGTETPPPATVTPDAVAPAAPSHTADGGAAPSLPVAFSAHDAQIEAAVLSFVNTVGDVQVVISGHEVVFYDPTIMGVLAPGMGLDSITWRLEDGSSVSLVGTAAELHAFHGLG